jgi:putrescine transport system substrate-binding protein
MSSHTLARGAGSKRQSRPRSRLEHERQARCDQDDIGADGGKLLVETTLSIAEEAAQTGFGHDTGPNLVGHKNHWPGKIGNRCGQPVAFHFDIALRQQPIAEPKRQAIDDDQSIGRRLTAQGGRKLMRLFDDLPGRIALGFMFCQPLSHFIVKGLRRGNQNGVLAGGFGELLRKTALARPRPADDEKTCQMSWLIETVVQFTSFRNDDRADSMKNLISILVFLLAALFAHPHATVAAERVVNIYNWSDYVDPKVLEDFTRETGIKVVYDTYDSNETLETRLLAGRTGYDLVAPSGTFLQRQIQAGLYQKLDLTKLPHHSELWPEVMKRLSVYDPGNQYAVAYMWFTTGIAYNVDKVKERIGDAPVNSWDLIFKPENLKKFADCGVYVLDSPEDLFSIALNYLKLDPNSKNPRDLLRASEELLKTMRRNVKKFHSSEYINALANGDICLAVGWAGDAFQARDRAREAGNGVNIDYIIPKEGTLMSIDALAIPKDALHLEEAYAFLDYLMRPEVAARNTRVTNFASGVLAAQALTAKEIADNKAIYPDADTMKRLFTVTSFNQATQKIVTSQWTQIKTGR